MYCDPPVVSFILYCAVAGWVGNGGALRRSFFKESPAVPLGLSGGPANVCCVAPGDEGGQDGPDFGAKANGMVWGDRGVSELGGGDADGEAVAPRSLRTPFMRVAQVDVMEMVKVQGWCTTTCSVI